MRLKVLVACEFSGVVREAFACRGHEAYSCDLLDTEKPGWHYKSDVLHLLDHDWDLLIAHPPCTFLANSSAKHLYIGMKKENGPYLPRWEKMREAALFYKALRDSKIKRKCIENPIMLGVARQIIGGSVTQIIQPHQFGHGETKATCLELINLPKLVPTNIVEGRHARVHREPPGPNRWKNRSRTLFGIAEAMADQYSAFILNESRIAA